MTEFNSLHQIVTHARNLRASDIHLESSLPPALRVDGNLNILDRPVPASRLRDWAVSFLGQERWSFFQDRKSIDVSETIASVRCRFNIYHTQRGVAFSIRLLSNFQMSIDNMNLHPDFKSLINHDHGLIIVSGATGSGKSTTLAAMIQHINQTSAKHIITVENPIEYYFKPRKSYIRQREVGRDTPDFNQALIDAMREDPDVLMVGEMREHETMRLTMNASETGHLVLATLHSSSVTDALSRIIAAFPEGSRSAVSAQLSECLRALICQRLVYLPKYKIRVPVCEIMVPNVAGKSMIRSGAIHKTGDALIQGRDNGCWTFDWYREWVDSRKNLFVQTNLTEAVDSEPDRDRLQQAERWKEAPKRSKMPPKISADYEISDDDGDLSEIISKLEED